MLKKLSAKTSFILVGIVVGFFIGVSIQQTFGDTTSIPGTVQGDNLTVNTGGQYTNGLIVANGNALVPNGKVGIGVPASTEVLTVMGKVLSSGGFCIGTSCVANWNDLKTMLGIGESNSSLTITTPLTLPTATVGTPYTLTFAATSGTGALTWYTDTTLPSSNYGGLMLGQAGIIQAGIISGTPTTAGTYNKFRITVVDSVGHSDVRVFTLVVSPSSGANPVLTITTPSTFPAAKVGAPYSFTLTSTGGNGKTVWSLPYGPRALPEGLVLDPDTGVISGIPAAGTAGVAMSNINLTRGTELTGIQFSLTVNR